MTHQSRSGSCTTGTRGAPTPQRSRKETRMSTGQTTLDVPPTVLEFLQGHQILTLATSSSAGIPRASTFLYVHDRPPLYFWTRATTTTARHLEQNPAVSFTIDEYTDDLRQTRGVQGFGECAVVLQGEQIARVAD